MTINEAEPDDLVNAEEAADGVQVQVSVPEDTVAGDVITLTVTQPNGDQFTVTDGSCDWNGEDPLKSQSQRF